MAQLIPVAGYCRTSGEGQRDNTSIPQQKKSIEEFCKLHGYELIGFYVDESKSGSKIEGREDYQRLMADGRKGLFDGVVVFKIGRLHRSNIMAQVGFLRTNFNIFTMDTAGFDNRQAGSSSHMSNSVWSLFEEAERLRIMERMIGGRIERARKGMRWAQHMPRFREFVYHNPDRHSEGGFWRITEKGHRFQTLLERYVKGEGLTALCRELGLSSPQYISASVRDGQLSANPYIATFHSPEIGIVNEQIEVPQVPAVISPELEQAFRDRAEKNRNYSRSDKHVFKLASFIRCAECGRNLSGVWNQPKYYYRHPGKASEICFTSIRLDMVEESVLDFLYRRFMDQPAIEKALKNAMPSDDERQQIIRRIDSLNKKSSRTLKQIENLVNAISQGADVSLLLSKQDELKAEKERYDSELKKLQKQLAEFPDPERVQAQAAYIQAKLIQKYSNRDWQQLTREEVQEFLTFLFGENPKRLGTGIFVEMLPDDKGWKITFKGLVPIPEELVNGYLVSPLIKKLIQGMDEKFNRDIEAGKRLADLQREIAEREADAERDNPTMNGNTDNSLFDIA